MTEQEWLTSSEPWKMLRHLETGESESTGKTLAGLPVVFAKRLPVCTDRKCRLFACACLLANGRDGLTVASYERDGIYDSTYSVRTEGRISDLEWAYNWTEVGSNKPSLAYRADLLRDIFGNPFIVIERLHRPPGKDRCWSRPRNPKPGERLITFDEGWLTWHDGAIPKIAQQMYDSRDFTDMPILADCLEEAGCTNEEILNHCRGKERSKCVVCSGRGRYKTVMKYFVPMPQVSLTAGAFESVEIPCGSCEGSGYHLIQTHHVRGCWVLDLLLGKV